MIVLSVGVLAAGWVPFEAFPKLDAKNVSGTVVFPDGTASFEAKDATLTLQQALYDVAEDVKQERGEEIIKVVYQRVGEVGDGFAGPTGVTNGSHVGTVGS